MQQIILKNDLEPSKLEALLYFLKSWNIEAELKQNKTNVKSKATLNLAKGIWKDNPIDAQNLRKTAWKLSNGTL